MVEWIKREIKSEKITIPEDYNQMQIAFNDWHHLTLRFFNGKNPDKDIIIVLDSHQTHKLMNFMRELLGVRRPYDP